MGSIRTVKRQADIKKNKERGDQMPLSVSHHLEYAVNPSHVINA